MGPCPRDARACSRDAWGHASRGRAALVDVDHVFDPALRGGRRRRSAPPLWVRGEGNRRRRARGGRSARPLSRLHPGRARRGDSPPRLSLAAAFRLRHGRAPLGSRPAGGGLAPDRHRGGHLSVHAARERLAWAGGRGVPADWPECAPGPQRSAANKVRPPRACRARLVDGVSRLACVLVEGFAAAALERCEPALRELPLAAVTGAPPATRVVEANARGRAEGVSPGLSDAEALVRCPTLVRRPVSAEAEAAARHALLEACLTVSPRIEDVAPGWCTSISPASRGCSATTTTLGRRLRRQARAGRARGARRDRRQPCGRRGGCARGAGAARDRARG